MAFPSSFTSYLASSFFSSPFTSSFFSSTLISILSYDYLGELKETLLNELTRDIYPSPNVSSSSTLSFLGLVFLACGTSVDDSMLL